MIEIGAVPSEPMFDDIFDSMVIEGIEGIAVSKETSENRVCVSIGKCGDVFIRLLLEGDPYAILDRVQITQHEYQSFESMLEGFSARNGMVASDVLDGESYMLKWRTLQGEFRFMLCNPRQLESDLFRRIGVKLEEWVKPKKTSWLW